MRRLVSVEGSHLLWCEDKIEDGGVGAQVVGVGTLGVDRSVVLKDPTKCNLNRVAIWDMVAVGVG